MTRSEPAGAEATQAIVRDRIEAAVGEPGVQDTLQVEWRGEKKNLIVISMPIDRVLYNPDTHRIKAQRDFDPERDQEIIDAPWGDKAQLYLDYLLGALPNDPSKPDPAFEKLQEDLQVYGQKEPGIITPSGILINGNSRCAALRKIGVPQMRVAVLPPDWTWDDLRSVELELQMRRDFRRDYSFVNYLLALDEAVANVGADNAMRAFRISKTAFNRSIWILQTLRELVEQSISDGGVSLNLRDFENDQGKLEELYRAYSALSKSDPDGADLLRESRLFALLLDKSKTDIRLVGQDFVDAYLKKNLGDDFGQGEASQTVSIPGLKRGISGDTSQLANVKKLVRDTAQSRAIATFSENGDEKKKAAEALKGLDKAIESALESAGKSARLKKSQQAAVDRINDAADGLDTAIQEIADAKSKQALDQALLADALVNLRQAMVRFANATTRIVDSETEGLKWLEKVRAIGDD